MAPLIQWSIELTLHTGQRAICPLVSTLANDLLDRDPILFTEFKGFQFGREFISCYLMIVLMQDDTLRDFPFDDKDCIKIVHGNLLMNHENKRHKDEVKQIGRATPSQKPAADLNNVVHDDFFLLFSAFFSVFDFNLHRFPSKRS
jgi:hypothetical protein